MQNYVFSPSRGRGSWRGWGIIMLPVFFLLTSYFLLPTPALAQQCVNNVPSTECRNQQRTFITNPNCACCGDCKLEDFTKLAVEASRFIFGITGSLALLMFAVGGFWWLTAAGTAERIEKGKKTLVAAVVGIIIIFGAWVIVNTLLASLTGRVNRCGVAEVLGGTWTETRCNAPRGGRP